uniref:Uncharacterized protein n=1 Tax=Romanomermis culicivorax TaxID=13658 RepID=A0A915L6X3_ROMCU
MLYDGYPMASKKRCKKAEKKSSDCLKFTYRITARIGLANDVGCCCLTSTVDGGGVESVAKISVVLRRFESTLRRYLRLLFASGVVRKLVKETIFRVSFTDVVPSKSILDMQILSMILAFSALMERVIIFLQFKKPKLKNIEEQACNVPLNGMETRKFLSDTWRYRLSIAFGPVPPKKAKPVLPVTIDGDAPIVIEDDLDEEATIDDIIDQPLELKMERIFGASHRHWHTVALMHVFLPRNRSETSVLAPHFHRRQIFDFSVAVFEHRFDRSSNVIFVGSADGYRRLSNDVVVRWYRELEAVVVFPTKLDDDVDNFSLSSIAVGEAVESTVS